MKTNLFNLILSNLSILSNTINKPIQLIKIDDTLKALNDITSALNTLYYEYINILCDEYFKEYNEKGAYNPTQLSIYLNDLSVINYTYKELQNIEDINELINTTIKLLNQDIAD